MTISSFSKSLPAVMLMCAAAMAPASAGCSGGARGPDAGGDGDAGDTAHSELPLLGPGLHLGTTLYGGGERPDGALLAVLEDAAGQGMGGFSFYVDWPDLERAPGDIDAARLELALAWQKQLGLRPLLNLSIIDIASLNFPPDLVAADGVRLAQGLSFDAQDVRTRLQAVLDAVVPPLADSGGFLLLLGNEVDEYFQDVPDADVAAYARLIGAARAHVRSLAPQMAVGVTLTSKALPGGDVVAALRPVTDVIPFNYYPLVTTWGDDWLSLKDLDEIQAELDELIALQAGGAVVIQELGCPSGEGSGSSPDHQALCFERMFDALARHADVRFIAVFTLFDFDEPTCDRTVELFGLGEEDLPGHLFSRWRSYLCTLGILTPSYSPKPAWRVFLDRLPRPGGRRG